MEHMSLSDDYIKDNFFGLSFSSQLKLLDLLSNDLKDTDFYYYFMDVFSKYISIVSRLLMFKSNFSRFDDEGRSDLRSIISNRSHKITPNNNVYLDNSKFFIDCDSDLFNSLYYPSIVDDCSVNQYIYDSFSYDSERRFQVAFNLAFHYSCVRDMKFKQLLNLCGCNRNLFNSEIKVLSKDFYSLYLSMDTVQRMTYIWYLSHLNPFVEDELINYKEFSGDDEFVYPSIVDDKKVFEERKVLYKYFKLD